MQFSSLTTLAFADIPEHDMTSANTLYSTIQQMSIGMGIAIGAVALRFSNVLNGGVPGQYTIPDFRLAFFFVTAIGFLHLFGYLGLSPTPATRCGSKKTIRRTMLPARPDGEPLPAGSLSPTLSCVFAGSFHTDGMPCFHAYSLAAGTVIG